MWQLFHWISNGGAEELRTPTGTHSCQWPYTAQVFPPQSRTAGMKKYKSKGTHRNSPDKPQVSYDFVLHVM